LISRRNTNIEKKLISVKLNEILSDVFKWEKSFIYYSYPESFPFTKKERGFKKYKKYCFSVYKKQYKKKA
jgi:hypothetical protein